MINDLLHTASLPRSERIKKASWVYAHMGCTECSGCKRMVHRDAVVDGKCPYCGKAPK